MIYAPFFLVMRTEHSIYGIKTCKQLFASQCKSDKQSNSPLDYIDICHSN